MARPEIGTAYARHLLRLRPAPGIDLLVMPAQQDLRHGNAVPVRRAGILRILKKPAGKAFLVQGGVGLVKGSSREEKAALEDDRAGMTLGDEQTLKGATDIGRSTTYFARAQASAIQSDLDANAMQRGVASSEMAMGMVMSQ